MTYIRKKNGQIINGSCTGLQNENVKNASFTESFMQEISAKSHFELTITERLEEDHNLRHEDQSITVVHCKWKELWHLSMGCGTESTSSIHNVTPNIDLGL